jgi:hypothetical protein
LKTLSTDQRHVVAAGDRVMFRPVGADGIIERIEPRGGSSSSMPPSGALPNESATHLALRVVSKS